MEADLESRLVSERREHKRAQATRGRQREYARSNSIQQRGFKREAEHQDTEACTTSSSLVQEADWQSSAAYTTYSQVKLLDFKARINVSVHVIGCRHLLVTGEDQ